MKVELNAELDEIRKAEQQLAQRKNAVRGAGIAECRKLVKMLDLTPADIFGEEAVPEKAKRERIVYVNPDDPSQTCSNYGRKPEWFTKLRDEGREIPRLQ